MVQDQLTELAALKEKVVARHVDVESLNQQAADLTRGASAQQAAAVREPLQVRAHCTDAFDSACWCLGSLWSQK